LTFNQVIMVIIFQKIINFVLSGFRMHQGLYFILLMVKEN